MMKSCQSIFFSFLVIYLSMSLFTFTFIVQFCWICNLWLTVLPLSTLCVSTAFCLLQRITNSDSMLELFLNFFFVVFLIAIIHNVLPQRSRVLCLTVKVLSFRSQLPTCSSLQKRRNEHIPSSRLAIPGDICETYDLCTLLPHLLSLSVL